jgi:hypothetical protein
VSGVGGGDQLRPEAFELSPADLALAAVKNVADLPLIAPPEVQPVAVIGEPHLGEHPRPAQIPGPARLARSLGVRRGQRPPAPAERGALGEHVLHRGDEEAVGIVTVGAALRGAELPGNLDEALPVGAVAQLHRRNAPGQGQGGGQDIGKLHRQLLQQID